MFNEFYSLSSTQWVYSVLFIKYCSPNVVRWTSCVLERRLSSWFRRPVGPTSKLLMAIGAAEQLVQAAISYQLAGCSTSYRAPVSVPFSSVEYRWSTGRFHCLLSGPWPVAHTDNLRRTFERIPSAPKRCVSRIRLQNLQITNPFAVCPTKRR